MIEIILSAALLCIDGECEPALVGKHTPVGEFTLSLVSAPVKPYGGDVLAFKVLEREIYAVHRPPSESRRNFLRGAPERDRRNITAGCVNVTDALYERLRDCCVGSPVVIRR